MIPVTSSNIKGLDYKGTTLTIYYNNGRIYEYYDVKQEVYDAFLNSESKGKFYWSNIHGKYKYEQI